MPMGAASIDMGGQKPPTEGPENSGSVSCYQLQSADILSRFSQRFRNRAPPTCELVVPFACSALGLMALGLMAGRPWDHTPTPEPTVTHTRG